MSPVRMRVDWTKCDGHGVCAELLPENVSMDEWGYPIIGAPEVPGSLEQHARHAEKACPALAFLLVPAGERPSPAAPAGAVRRS